MHLKLKVPIPPQTRNGQAMKKISGFDLGIIIAFVVVTLMAGGAWWYLSGQLQVAQDDVHAANDAFKKYSANSKYLVVVSAANQKALQANIDLIKAQLGPLIKADLQPKDNKLHSVEKEDPVAWKHDLEDELSRAEHGGQTSRGGPSRPITITVFPATKARM